MADENLAARLELPSTHWNPAYLGEIYVLNHNIPAYMFNNGPGEANVIDWIRNYLLNAETIKTQFNAIFNLSPSPYMLTKLNALFAYVVEAREAVIFYTDYLRSWRACSRILLYSSHHVLPPSPDFQSPPAPTVFGGWSPAPVVLGLVGLIDMQVRLLREHPDFNQQIAELLNIIPKAPPSVDLATLTPNVRVRNMGGFTEVTFRGPAGIPGVWAAVVQVDRGDGVLETVPSEGGRCIDKAPQPERASTWVYYVHYEDRSGVFIGVQSSASVTVQAPRG